MDRQLFMLGPIIHICYVTIIHFMQKIWELLLIVHLWLHTASYDWSDGTPIWLYCICVIYSIRKEITLNKQEI